MVHWKAEIKERGRDGILTPSYSIPEVPAYLLVNVIWELKFHKTT